MQRYTIKEVKPAPADGKPTIVIDDTGAKMSGFDTGLKELCVGDVIEVELKPKGNYLNIVDWRLVEKAGQAAAVPVERGGWGADEIDARYRIAALEGAVETSKIYRPVGEQTPMDYLAEMADCLYGWLKRGRPAAVKAGPKQEAGEAVKEAAVEEEKKAEDDSVPTGLPTFFAWLQGKGKTHTPSWFYGKFPQFPADSLSSPERIKEAHQAVKKEMGW